MVNIKRKRKIITMSLVFLMILFNVFVPGPEPGLNEKSEIRIKQKYTTVYAGEIVSENNKTNEEEQTDEEKEEIVEDDQAAVSKDDPGKNVPSADGLPKEIIPEDDNTSGGNEEIQNRSGMAHTDQILEVDNGPLAPVITEYTISYPEDTQEEYTPWELLTITAYESHDGSPVKYIRWSSAGYGKDGWYEIDKNPDKLSFLITSNVTHRVIIKTEKGNEGYMTFRFPKIDGTWPVIIKEGNNNIRLKMKQPVYNGKCKEAVLSIVAEDHELGLHEKAYLFADFEDAYKAAYEKPLADSYESGTFWQASNEFVISENKEYGGYVRDKAGNIRISFRNIDCIDNTSPSAVAEEIYKPYGGFISEDRIVVSDVKDNPGGAGIPDKCFSWDHGEWTDENEFVVKKNGPVSLRVRDGLDNITEKILEIDHNFDVDPPVLEPIDVKPTVSYGNVVGGVWLRAEAIDDNSQAEGLSYSFDGGQTWTSSSVMEVSKNGTYTIITRDITGNVSEPRRVIISNIDNKGPVIAEPKLSYGRRAGGYYKDVTIKVSADDAQAVLNEKPYSFNGGEFSKEDSYTVRTNGDVKITARDCFENESEKIINISKIDCEGPVIEITGNPTSTVYKSCRLDIKAVDNKSGVTEIWYKNNTANVPSLLQNYGVNSDGMGRETGSSSATINLNGSYTFYAYDALGNMSEQTVTVSKISKQKEEDRDSQDNSKGKSSDSSEKKQTSEEDKKMVLSPGIVTSGTAENVISKTGYSSSGSDSGSVQDGKGIVIKSRNDEETESETDGEITFKNANGDGELDFYVDESIDEETQNESAYVLPEESTEETVESSESISPQNYSQGAVQSDPAVELINTAGGEEEKKKGNVLPVVGGVAAALLGAGGGGLVILNKKGLIDLATLLEKKKG